MQDMDVFDAMIRELEAAEPIFLPSDFWQDLNEKNNRMLKAEGLANFKRTVSQNYFNWVITDYKHMLFRHALHQWRLRPNLLPIFSRIREMNFLHFTTNDDRVVLTKLQQHVYRLYVCFVWTIMTSHDRQGLRHRVAEPEVGNPFRVQYGDLLLSQDLATSIVECNVVADLLTDTSRPRIAEVGAGYGRLAYTYISTLPGQYYIFDIPPALGVAQWYLEQTFGRDRVFRFRHFNRLDAVQDEINHASIVLLTPNQIRMFPDGYFDVILTISTLPEMRRDQVDLYLSEFQRLSHGHIFIKQFKAWKNPTDGTDLTADSYVLGSEWRNSLDRPDPIIPIFFNRVWSRINQTRAG
jgi:putative sugar O-methyltransferase